MVGFPACFICLCLLCQLTGPAASGALKELAGALGGSVTFPLELPEQPVDSIVWTFNTTFATLQPAGTNKLANIIVTQSHNKNRVSFLDRNYSLTLSQLRKNDSGAYRVEIHSSFQSFTQKYVLRIYEHLPKPRINVGLQTNENGTCMTNLSCSMEQEGEDVIYSWNSLGQTANESHEGFILPITWRPEEGNVTFICMVRNPISCNLSNPISAWKLCEGASGDKDTSVVFLYLLLPSLLLSLLLLGLVIATMKRERRKVPEIIEEKKGMDNQQEIPKFRPHSGENTEDDTILHPNKTVSEDPVNTIYSIVQTPEKVEKPHSPSSTSDAAGVFIYEHII